MVDTTIRYTASRGPQRDFKAGLVRGLALAALAMTMPCSGRAQAAIIVSDWYVSSNETSISIASDSKATRDGATFASILPQGVNSLTTTAVPMITRNDVSPYQAYDFRSVLDTATGISSDFGGPFLFLANSGNWDPLHTGTIGTAPANFGAISTVFGSGASIALRDAAIAPPNMLLSGPIVGTSINYTIPYGGNSILTEDLLIGSVDYRGLGLLTTSMGSGSTNLHGISGADNTYHAKSLLKFST